ncbi:MAG: RloB family protein [Methanomassiliicoccaceae archaeon]|nr:RloB family protein [Methanomassiliicoccaceae archaeon]
MSRKPGKRSAALFYIFAEGKATERTYFENNYFGRSPRIDRKRPQINRGHRRGQDPDSIKRWVEETMGKVSNKNDIVWILIDKDANSSEKLYELKRWCDAKGFRLALSNPQFEYWYVLHFDYLHTNVNKETLQNLLEKYLKCSRYEKGECYSKELSPHTDKAIKHAERLREEIDKDKYCDHNPFTNVDSLIKGNKEVPGLRAVEIQRAVFEH